MRINRKLLAKLITDRLSQSESPRHLSRQVAAYLLESGQTSQLASLVRDVQMERADRGHLEVIAETAHPLSADTSKQLSRLAKQVFSNAKTIQVTELNRPDVIGGVRLRSTAQELDLSVNSRLNKLKSPTGASY